MGFISLQSFCKTTLHSTGASFFMYFYHSNKNHSMNRKLQIALSIIFISVFNFASAQYPSQNITLLSNFDDATVPANAGYGIRYNGIWGWADNNGREYACIGATNGVYIIEVTNPTNPVQRDFIQGCVTGCTWRELKTYDHYLYMVSDDGGANCMQIADLSYLPDSVHIVHQSDTIIKRCHSIFIDGDKLYGGGLHDGASGPGSTNMAVFSLANPVVPILLRKLSQDYPAIGYVHDMFVRSDTIYASAAYDGMQIYKYDTTANNFTQLASITSYPSMGYNHSCALTDDSKTLIFADEVPVGLPLKAYNITNLQNPVFGSTFKSTTTSTATPHNPFMMKDHYCVVSYYQDGVQIFDVSNPANVVRTGYFDSNPNNGLGLPHPDYSGCWGAYCEFPSGNIIASDMQHGLFVLDASIALGIAAPSVNQNSISVYPNPIKDFLTVLVNTVKDETFSIEIFDVCGKIVLAQSEHLYAGKSNLKLNLTALAAGFYVIKINEYAYNFIK